MNASKVAIIILNWNGWKDTIECLESVFRIDYPNYQVIVVDNGSTDDSVKKIKAWAEGKQEVLTPELTHPLYHLSHPPVQKPIPYIEYDRETTEAGGFPEKEKLLYNKLSKGIPHPMVLIQTRENLGFAGGNNVGIIYAMAKGDCDYIWLLNNDTVVEKNVLMKIVKLVESFKEIGIAGGKIYCYNNPEKLWFAGGHINFLFGGGFHSYKDKNQNFYNSFDFSTECDFITGCSMLIKKAVLSAFSGFDERFFLNYEDIDFCYQVKKNGWKIRVANNSRIFHKVSGSQKKGSCILLYHVNRSRLVWIRKTIKNEKRLYVGLCFYILSRGWVILKLLYRFKFKAALCVVRGVRDGFIA